MARGRFRRVRLNGQVRDTEPRGEADSAEAITLAGEAKPLQFVTPE